MVGFSASWKVSGLVSGLALISSDWLTEMKSTPDFLVCSLMAICTWAARPPTTNCTCSFSINSFVRWAPMAGLSWSSRKSTSTLRPRMPFFAFSSSMARVAPRCWSTASAPNGPVRGSGKPILITSLLWARRIAGKPKTAAPAAVVVRNVRRFIVASYRQASRRSRGRARRFPGVKWSDHRSAAQSCQRGTVPPAMPHVGSSARRGDDPRLLTGRGRYVDDVTLPRMVHVAFVRSPHAPARVVGIDAGDARRAPGVACVLTGGDTPRPRKAHRGVPEDYRGLKTGAMTPLALERVRCVGEPVVAIAAETAAAGHDAAALVSIEYRPLPAVLDPDAATAPGAPVIHPQLGDHVIYETTLHGGEPDAAFATAARVWRRRFTTG